MVGSFCGSLGFGAISTSHRLDVIALIMVSRHFLGYPIAPGNVVF